MKVDYAQAIAAHRFDLIFENETLAALIETVACDDALLIENVAVEPAFQRRGLGRALMEHAEQLALADGLSSVRLYTNARFAENLRLYARLGYTVEREEALNGGVAIHMRKRL